MPDRSFPRTLVRDLLGLVRLLYRAEQDVDLPEGYGRLGRLEEAGRALREALEMARRNPASTRARQSAERGVTILLEIIREQHPELTEVVRIASRAIRRQT